MKIYLICVRTLFLIFLVLCLVIGFLLLIKELGNFNFYVKVYNENINSLEIIINNLIIYSPLVLPIILYIGLNCCFFYLRTKNILNFVIKSGNNPNIFYLIIFASTLFFIIMSTPVTHILSPQKLQKNTHSIKKMIYEKPYLKFEPHIFNRLSNNYLIYFTNYSCSKNELENVVVYNFFKGRLKNITHVTKGKIQKDGGLSLTGGISIVLGKSGITGKPIYVTEDIDKEEIINNRHVNALYPNYKDIPDFMTSTEIYRMIAKIGTIKNYLKNFEINRRILLSLISLLSMMILSLYTFHCKVNSEMTSLFLSSIFISLLFITKEVYFKSFAKYIFRNSVVSLWIIDLLFFLVAIGLIKSIEILIKIIGDRE